MIDMEKVTSAKVLESRSAVTEFLNNHLELWNELKQQLTNQDRSFKASEMYNIIEICLDDNDIKSLIGILSQFKRFEFEYISP